MLICPQCGRQVFDNSNFCDGCGAALAPAGGFSSPPPVMLCPRCQQPVSGDAYCEHCGAALTRVQTNVQSVPPPPALAITRFVLQPANIIFPFPAGKQSLLIGREDPNLSLVPEINLEAYGGAEAGVSRQHARAHFDGGQWWLEHLSQTNKTQVNDLVLGAGQPCALKNGDMVALGRLILIFRT